jgi:hypothetical protein
MSDLCGSSENIISIVNFTLRKGLDNKNDVDDKRMFPMSTSTNTNQVLSKESSSSPTKESSKNNNGNNGNGENDKNIDGNNNKNNIHQADNQDKDNSNKDVVDTDDDNEDKIDGENNQDDMIAPVSDLSDISRRICVVTTAGLPWRYVNLPTFYTQFSYITSLRFFGSG